MLNIAFCFDEVEKEQIEDIFDFLSDTRIIGHKAALLHYYEFVRHLREELTEISLIISQNRSLRLIDSSEVRFIEVRKRIITIHTPQGSYDTYISLRDAEYRLNGLGFLRVHRYYLVAERHIVLVGKTELALDTGQKIPVGRAYRKNLEEYLFNGRNIEI